MTDIVRTAIVDDDGSLTTGTIWNNAYKQEEYDQIDDALHALDAAIAAVPTGGSPVVQTTTSTGTQNDFALTAGCTLLRCNNATLLTLTGFAAGADGQRVQIVSVGAGQVNVTDQAAGSTAANRVITGNSATHAYEAGKGTLAIEYDVTTARWRIVSEKTMRFRCSAYKSVTQSLANNTTTAVTYDTDTVDIGAIHDTSTNPARFTIPVGGTGQWLARFQTGFLSNVNARYIVSLNKNGAAYQTGFDLQATPTAAVMELSASGIVLDAVEGDYFEQVAYQNSGAAKDLNYGAINTTSMSMIKLD